MEDDIQIMDLSDLGNGGIVHSDSERRWRGGLEQGEMRSCFSHVDLELVA